MSLESLPSNISEHLSQVGSQVLAHDLAHHSSCDQEVECNLPLAIKPEKYFAQKTVKSNNKGLDIKRQTFFKNKAELFLSENDMSDTLVPPKVHAPHHTLQQKNFHFLQNPGDQETQNHLSNQNPEQKEHNYDYQNFLLNRMDYLLSDLPLQSSVESEENIIEPKQFAQTEQHPLSNKNVEKTHQRTMSYKDNFNLSKEKKLQAFQVKVSPHSEHIFIDNPHIEIDLSNRLNNNYQPCGDRSDNFPTFATYSSVEEEYPKYLISPTTTSTDSFPVIPAQVNKTKTPSSHAKENKAPKIVDQSDKENKSSNKANNSKKNIKRIKVKKSQSISSNFVQISLTNEPCLQNKAILSGKKKSQEEQSFKTPCLEKEQSFQIDKVVSPKETNDWLKMTQNDVDILTPFSPINTITETAKKSNDAATEEISPKTIPLMSVKDCPRIYGPSSTQPKPTATTCSIENACILGNIIQSNKALIDHPKVTIKLSDDNEQLNSPPAQSQPIQKTTSQKIRDLLTKRNEHILKKIIGKANIDYPLPIYSHLENLSSNNLSVEIVDTGEKIIKHDRKGAEKETINVSYLSERCISEPNGFYIKKVEAEVESELITKSFDDHKCVEPKSKSFIKIENQNQDNPHQLRRNKSDSKLNSSLEQKTYFNWLFSYL